MQHDVHERFDLSDVEVLPPLPPRPRRTEPLDGELDALVAELENEYRLAS